MGLAALAFGAAAQTPRNILALKLGGYLQSSATATELAVVQFAFITDFSGVLPASNVVQLRSPAGAIGTLERGSDGTYFLTRGFASSSAMEASYPDGVYTLSVSGENPSSLNITLVTGTASHRPGL